MPASSPVPAAAVTMVARLIDANRGRYVCYLLKIGGFDATLGLRDFTRDSVMRSDMVIGVEDNGTIHILKDRYGDARVIEFEPVIERWDGGAPCPLCGVAVREHPMAPEITYGGEPFVHRLCDGTLAKT